jgi:hypothetical protein
MKTLLAFILTATSLIGASIQVTWDPHPDTNVVSFNVYTSTTNGIVSVNQVTNAPTTVSNLLNGVEYKIEVSAINRIGLESELSLPLFYTPSATLQTPGPITLSGYMFSGSGKFSVQFTWPAVPGTNILGYRMKWGPTTNKANTLNLVSTLATLSGLLNGTNYYMSLETLDKNGNKSDPSPDYIFRNDFEKVKNVRTTLQTFTSPSQVP